MIHYLSERIAVFLFDNNDKYPLDIYIYGIELTLSSLLGTVIILMLGVFSGLLIESIIFMISLSLIRIFTGGYHASTYLRCNSVLIVSYIFVAFAYRYYLSHLTEYTYLIASIIFFMLFFIVAIFSPVKTERKDISGQDRRKFKILSLVIAFTYLLLFMLFYGILGVKQVIVILPTMVVVGISILVEIIFNERRNSNERLKTEIKGNG